MFTVTSKAERATRVLVMSTSTNSSPHRCRGTNRLRTLLSSFTVRQERAFACCFGLLVEGDLKLRYIMRCDEMQSMCIPNLTMSIFMRHKITDFLCLSLEGKHEQERRMRETIARRHKCFIRSHKPATTRCKHEQERNSVEQK